jgi:hypothetical protein
MELLTPAVEERWFQLITDLSLRIMGLRGLVVVGDMSTLQLKILARVAEAGLIRQAEARVLMVFALLLFLFDLII